MTIVSSYTLATVISLQTLCTCIIYTLGQYVYTYYLHIYPYSSSNTNENSTAVTIPSYLHKNHNTSGEKCAKSNISVDSYAQAWAQQRSADLFFWTNVYSCIPIIIMTYILGLHTPKLGRRFVLILPMLGTAVQVSIWLMIIYFNLPEHWWYIAALIVGLTGSDNVRNFVLNLFITENTDENERSARFVLFGGISMIVSAIGTFVIGYYIAWHGFTDLYWIAFLLQISSIFIVIFFFKSEYIYHYKPLTTSDYSLIMNEIKISKTNCNSYFDMCHIFAFKKQSKKKSICLLLTLFAYATYSFIYTAFIVLLLYLLNTPFCWTSKQIGNFSATALISFGILSVLGMKILTKLGACDIMICIISHIFLCLTSYWIAFAKYDWQMYAGLLLTSFSGYQNLLTLSMISKWLETHDRTNAFTFVTEINTIMKVLGYCFFNWVYARTVVNYKNFTFLLAANLSLIPLILNIALWLVSKWMPDDISASFEETDMKPMKVPVATDWPPQFGDANSFIIPQQLSNLSRTNSTSSADHYTLDIYNSDTL